MEQPNCYESKEQLRNELVGTVAIAIQRGNSYALQQGHMLTCSANVQTAPQLKTGTGTQVKVKQSRTQIQRKNNDKDIAKSSPGCQIALRFLANITPPSSVV